LLIRSTWIGPRVARINYLKTNHSLQPFYDIPYDPASQMIPETIPPLDPAPQMVLMVPSPDDPPPDDPVHPGMTHLKSPLPA